MDRDNIIDHIKKLQQHEREEIIAECVKRFGVIFGDWEIGLKEENTILFINKIMKLIHTYIHTCFNLSVFICW